jgi:hypothetical protein
MAKNEKRCLPKMLAAEKKTSFLAGISFHFSAVFDLLGL